MRLEHLSCYPRFLLLKHVEPKLSLTSKMEGSQILYPLLEYICWERIVNNDLGIIANHQNHQMKESQVLYICTLYVLLPDCWFGKQNFANYYLCHLELSWRLNEFRQLLGQVTESTFRVIKIIKRRKVKFYTFGHYTSFCPNVGLVSKILLLCTHAISDSVEGSDEVRQLSNQVTESTFRVLHESIQIFFWICWFSHDDGLWCQIY